MLKDTARNCRERHKYNKKRGIQYRAESVYRIVATGTRIRLYPDASGSNRVLFSRNGKSTSMECLSLYYKRKVLKHLN